MDIRVLGDPKAGDRAAFRVMPGFGGVPLLAADFHNFSFAPHSHDCVMIGLILEGEKRFRRTGRAHAARGPAITVVNAGEVHTGGTVGDGSRLRYLGIYPTPALVAAAGLRLDGDFPEAVILDPALRRAFLAALAAEDALAAEAGLVTALAALADRHGAVRAQPVARPDGRAVARARDYMEAALDRPLRLEEIAAAAGVTPRHLIRSFGARLGLSPQRYLRQARVARAAALLRRGEAPVQAAVAAGFADQAHLTRAFRAALAVTPAAYARAFAAAA